MAGISSPWCSPEVINYLVDKSSGYFIYAATVIKFIDDRNFRPTEQLEELQDASYPESPFSALDQLYTQILLMVPTRHRHSLLWILWALEFFKFRLNSGFWHLNRAIFSSSCGAFTPSCTFRTLNMTSNAGSQCTTLRFETSSMINPVQAFYVGGPQHQVELGKSVLKALSYTYNNPEVNLAGPVAV
ncbi:hypothetical protein C8J57DRAFT_1513577 [Mycena rebaudengoi]|nr:hypothetical protein C8J57DRAFT_1513577 [Mycena rebaudengoi]